jgi:tRNA-specific 2-thiouridylase
MAMSGGVDSSVGAALLQRAGYDVVGVFMRLGSPGETLDVMTEDGGEACAMPTKAGAGVGAGTGAGASSGPGAKGAAGGKIHHQGCCSVSDAADARLVAAQLGIPFYVVNFKKDFGRIMDYFASEYGAGRTPNPCVRCNDWLKFGKLHDYAAQIDAQFVASGHYAQVVDGQLRRGEDLDKDQSYVLFGVPRAQLGHMLLPIGSMRKHAVRALAEEFGLRVFNKPDSQEICFVPDNDYAGFVSKRLGEATPGSGAIVDPSGKVVGTHDGQHRFTVGQRRGVGVALGYPIFVVQKDAASNTITVGPREMLRRSGCIAGEANWLIDEPGPDETIEVLATYRSHGALVRAEVRGLAAQDAGKPTPSGRTGRFSVTFAEAQEAVAPGQAIVLYDAATGRRVLGGGWIESAS